MQKAQRLGLMLALLMSFMMVASTAMAQQTANVGQLVSGLINVNVGAIQVTDVLDVELDNVLNDNEIRILNNVLNRNEVLSRNQLDLTVRLQNIDILNDSQVVVGVLSGGIVVVQEVVE